MVAEGSSRVGRRKKMSKMEFKQNQVIELRFPIFPPQTGGEMEILNEAGLKYPYNEYFCKLIL